MDFKQPVSVGDLGGMMGESEMELACVRIVNKSKQNNVALSRVRFVEADFVEGYERDGFKSLVANGWTRVSHGRYALNDGLLARIRKRLAKLREQEQRMRPY